MSVDQKGALQGIKLQDQLLISCPGARGGLVYAFGQQTLVLSSLASTGLYVDENRMLVGSQADGGRFMRHVDQTGYDDIELSEDELDLHDLYLKDDSFYVVATERNQVIEYDSSFKAVDHWGLSGEHDSAHINSVVSYQGSLITSVFGRFKVHRGYKAGTKGLGEVIDIKRGETLIDGLSQPHSLTVEGELLYLCNSEAKELRVYCGIELKQKLALGGYARGIAIGRNCLYVGLSASRNVKDHHLKGSSVVVLDKESLAVKGYIRMPFPEVYDIRVVNGQQDLVLKTVSIDDHSQLTKAYDETLVANAEIKQAYDETLEANAEIKQAYDETLVANTEIKKANAEIQQAYDKTLEANAAIQQAYDETLEVNGELTQAYEQVLGAYKQTKEAYEQTKEAYEQTKEAYEQSQGVK